MERRVYWRWCRRILACLVIGLVLSLVAVWMMFQHVPSWYRPTPIPPGQYQAVRDDLVRTFTTFSDQLVDSPRSFVYELSQEQINAWLIAPQEISPQARKWLPRGLSDPQVAIDVDGLRLAAKFNLQGVESIVSMHLAVKVLPDRLTIQLLNTATGSLPLPQDVVLEQFARLEGRWWPVGERIPNQVGDMTFPPLAQLGEGIDLPVVWIWRNGERPFRITDLEYEPGVVRLTVEPLPR